MWAANARWVCTFALGFYRFARQCEIPIIKRCFLLYMRAANGSDKSAQLNRLALVTRQCVKYQNVMLAQMAFWVPLMQAAKAVPKANALMSLHQKMQTVCATIAALYQCFKSLLVRCNKTSSIKMLVYPGKS